MTAQQLLGKEYTKIVDYWAVGVALYFLMAKKYPFRPSNNYKKMFAKEMSFDKEAIDFYPKELIDFVTKLLALKPEERLGYKGGIEEILNHDVFKNIQLPSDEAMKAEFAPDIFDFA